MTDGDPVALVPHVTVVLDRERLLVEDFAALALFEQHTGLNARDPEVMANLNLQQTAVYTWALLRRDDPNLDLATVQAWSTQPRYHRALYEAHMRLQTVGLEMAAEAAGDDAGEGEGGGPLGGSAGSSSSPGRASTSG